MNMMVRLDKILHMITCFKWITPGLEDDQYSTPPENIEISSSSLRVMKRIGAISRGINMELNRKTIISFFTSYERRSNYYKFFIFF